MKMSQMKIPNGVVSLEDVNPCMCTRHTRTTPMLTSRVCEFPGDARAQFYNR